MDKNIIEKFSKLKLAYLIIPAIIIGAFIFGDWKSKNESEKTSCLMSKMTLEKLIPIAAQEGITVTQKDVDEINETPLCRDVCIEQRKYAQENSDWWANDDIRKICEEMGLSLPEK